jgi:hypothetical protein
MASINAKPSWPNAEPREKSIIGNPYQINRPRDRYSARAGAAQSLALSIMSVVCINGRADKDSGLFERDYLTGVRPDLPTPPSKSQTTNKDYCNSKFAQYRHSRATGDWESEDSLIHTVSIASVRSFSENLHANHAF